MCKQMGNVDTWAFEEAPARTDPQSPLVWTQGHVELRSFRLRSSSILESRQPGLPRRPSKNVGCVGRGRGVGEGRTLFEGPEPPEPPRLPKTTISDAWKVPGPGAAKTPKNEDLRRRKKTNPPISSTQNRPPRGPTPPILQPDAAPPEGLTYKNEFSSHLVGCLVRGPRLQVQRIDALHLGDQTKLSMLGRARYFPGRTVARFCARHLHKTTFCVGTCRATRF